MCNVEVAPAIVEHDFQRMLPFGVAEVGLGSIIKERLDYELLAFLAGGGKWGF